MTQLEFLVQTSFSIKIVLCNVNKGNLRDIILASWDTVRGREKADYSWSRLQLLLAAPHTDNPGFWTGREIAELHGVAATPGCAGSGAPGSTWQHLETPGSTWQHLACYSSDKTALLLPIKLTI